MNLIEQTCEWLNKAIQTARTPIATIPSALIASSVINRPGLSAMMITSNIIRRQSEAGAPVGPAADGSENIAEAMERIRVEEIIKAIKLDGRVQVAIPIGAIQITGTGANAGGPVVITGTNTNIPHGDGILG